jgi:hypothetical protein
LIAATYKLFPCERSQNPELFKRLIERVLRELIGDMRLAGKQHCPFHEYKDPHGNRMFAGDANGAPSWCGYNSLVTSAWGWLGAIKFGAVSFQLAQARIGPNKVPVSIVLYIDCTFLKKGIPIRPIYGEHQCDEAVRVRCNEMK